MPFRSTGLVLALSLVVLAGCGISQKRMNDARVHYTLGVSYLEEPNPTLALKEFLIAESLNPNDAEVEAALGQAYHLKKAYALAEQHILQALELDRDNPRYQNNLAALYLDTNRYDDAIRFFRLAAANLLFSNPETAFAGIGYAYYLKGDYAAAVSSYQQALSRSPRYALAHFRLGETFFALGKDQDAIREFRQTVALLPNDPVVHYRLGLAYFKAKNKEQATSAFRDVIRMAPDSEEAKLAQSYLNMLR